MKKNKKIFIVSFLIGFICTGCNNKSINDTKEKTETTVIVENESYYRHSSVDLPDNIHITKGAFYNDDLYYLGEYEKCNSKMSSVVLNSEYQLLDSCDINIDGYNFENISLNIKDTDIYYAICSDENGFIKFIRYNGNSNKIERSVDIDEIPEKIWCDGENIFTSSISDTEYTIYQYNQNLELTDMPEITGLPENEFISDLRYIDGVGYSCLLFNDSFHFIMLNRNFEYMGMNDIGLQGECSGYTIKDGTSALVYEKSEENEYAFYEVSLDNCDTVDSFTMAIDEPYDIFDGFGKYEFLMADEDGIYGYDMDLKEVKCMYEFTSGYVTDIKAVSNDKLQITLNTTEKLDNKVFTTNKEDVSLDITYDDENLYDFFIDGDKNFYFLYADIEKQKDYIVKKDKNNQIVNELEICAESQDPVSISVSAEVLCILAEDYIDSNMSVALLNSSEDSLIRTVTVSDFEILSEECIYDACFINDNMYIMSSDKIFEIDNKDNISVVAEFNDECNLKFIGGPEIYDFCFSNDYGIYGYISAEKTIIQIASWDKCDINVPYKNMVHVISNDSFNIIGTEDIEFRPKLYRFKKADNSEGDLNNKTEINIAGVSLSDEYISSNGFINLVNRINNSSNDIKISLTNYKDYDSMQKGLVSGDIPDIVFSPATEVWLPDLLTDLSSYMESSDVINDEEYFTNLLKINNKITSVFSSFSLYTLFGKESEIGSTELWSGDEFVDLINKNYDTNAVLGIDVETAMSMMFISNLNSYIDYQHNICNFDDPKTCELMNSVKKMFTNPDPVIFNDDYSEIDKRFLDNKCYIDLTVISTPELVGYFRDDYVGDTVAYKGIPSANKCSPIAEPDFCIGILEKSKHKKEAWTIIEQIFTDNFQEQSLYLPLKRSVFREKIEKFRGSNLTDNEIDNIEKLIEQTSTLIFNDSKLSDSIYSDILSFINDEKDAESTAKSIQKKVTYYMNEGK